MENNAPVASFKVDHMRLVPGVYISRQETCGDRAFLTTFDIRVKRPNFEPAMSSEEAHTIEHIGAVFLRNVSEHKEHIVYFGPFGCLTGFALVYKSETKIVTGDTQFREIVRLVLAMMRFVVTYGGTMESVGFDAESCGNYSLNDLAGAKNVCANFLTLDEALGALKFEYPTATNSPEIATSTSVNGDDKLNKDLVRARKSRQEVAVDYDEISRDVNSYISLPEGPEFNYMDALLESIGTLRNLPIKREDIVSEEDKNRLYELAFPVVKLSIEEDEEEKPKIFNALAKPKKKTSSKKKVDDKKVVQNVLF